MAIATVNQSELRAVDLARAIRKAIALQIMNDDAINERLSILAALQEICPETAVGSNLFEFQVAADTRRTVVQADTRRTVVQEMKRREKETGEWEAVEVALGRKAESEPLNGLISEYLQFFGTYRAERGA